MIRKPGTYELTLAGPDRTSTLYSVGAERVIHIRYAQDPERPWRGVGPIQAAALAGRLSAETLEALGDEASGPRGSFLPTPEKDGQDDTLTLMRADVRKAKGSMLFVESMADDFGGGAPRAPQDWAQKRFGMMVPTAAVELSSMVSREIVSACGVSPTLFDPKSSAAMREAWRQLLFRTVAPLGKNCRGGTFGKAVSRINPMAGTKGVRSASKGPLRGFPSESRRGSGAGNGDSRAFGMSNMGVLGHFKAW